MKLAKYGLFGAAVAGVLSLTATMAEAKGFSAGYYRLIGENGANQTLCVRADGSWYGVSFSPWGGRWVNRNLNGTLTGFLYGNYASGAGNDSVVALGVANSKWTEWRDNLSTNIALNQVRITKLGGACPVASPRASSADENPAQ